MPQFPLPHLTIQVIRHVEPSVRVSRTSVGGCLDLEDFFILTEISTSNTYLCKVWEIRDGPHKRTIFFAPRSVMAPSKRRHEYRRSVNFSMRELPLETRGTHLLDCFPCKKRDRIRDWISGNKDKSLVLIYYSDCKIYLETVIERGTEKAYSDDYMMSVCLLLGISPVLPRGSDSDEWSL